MKVEAYMCLQCGSMSWLLVSDNYTGKYCVRKDGHVEFKEEFADLECVCGGCGSHSSLIGLNGTPKVYRELVRLQPMQRILRALNLIVDGTLELVSDTTPDEVADLVEIFVDRWQTLHKDAESCRVAEDFLLKTKEVIGKWKLLE